MRTGNFIPYIRKIALGVETPEAFSFLKLRNKQRGNRYGRYKGRTSSHCESVRNSD